MCTSFSLRRPSPPSARPLGHELSIFVIGASRPACALSSSRARSRSPRYMDRRKSPSSLSYQQAALAHSDTAFILCPSHLRLAGDQPKCAPGRDRSLGRAVRGSYESAREPLAWGTRRKSIILNHGMIGSNDQTTARRASPRSAEIRARTCHVVSRAPCCEYKKEGSRFSVDAILARFFVFFSPPSSPRPLPQRHATLAASPISIESYARDRVIDEFTLRINRTSVALRLENRTPRDPTSLRKGKMKGKLRTLDSRYLPRAELRGYLDYQRARNLPPAAQRHCAIDIGRETRCFHSLKGDQRCADCARPRNIDQGPAASETTMSRVSAYGAHIRIYLSSYLFS